MCLLPFRMSRGRGRGRRQRGFDDDNGFEAWGGYMNAKKAKLEEQYLKDRGMYRMFQQVLVGNFQMREITIVRKFIKLKQTSHDFSPFLPIRFGKNWR